MFLDFAKQDKKFDNRNKLFNFFCLQFNFNKFIDKIFNYLK